MWEQKDIYRDTLIKIKVNGDSHLINTGKILHITDDDECTEKTPCCRIFYANDHPGYEEKSGILVEGVDAGDLIDLIFNELNSDQE